MLDALRLLAVYGGSCALILWLIHRTLRPVAPSVALVLMLLPFAFTGKAMLTGGLYGSLNLAYNTTPLDPDRAQLPERAYHNGILMDQVCQVIPWRKAVRDAVKTGHWPLWNRYARGGDVLLGLGQPAPFDPKVWIGFFLPLATAITFACSFVFFQAAGFTWLYLRELDLSDGAAILGGAAYMASGFFTFWVGWSMSSVWAVLPLLVFGVHRLAHGTRGGFGATVAAGTLALVGGHPESVLHISTMAGLVMVVEWHLAGGLARTWPRIRRALAAALLIGCLSAPAVLPFVDAMVQTADFQARTQHVTHHTSVELRQASRSMMGALFPWAYGRPHQELVDSKPKAFDTASLAGVGGAAWILAVLGLGFGGRRPGGNGLRRWLYGSLLAVCLAVASKFPVLTEALGHLPLYRITLNERLAGVAAFALAVLAAFGTDCLLRGGVRDAGLTRRTLGLAMSLLTALAFWHLAAADLPETVARAYVLSLSAVLLPALVLTLAGTKVWFRRASYAAPVLLMLVLTPRTAETFGLYKTFPPEHFFPPIPELASLPDFPRDGSEPYRVTGYYLDMTPALGTLWHLEDPRGYATMRHYRQRVTLPLWCEPSTAWWFCQVRDLERPFLSALGVRYLVAPPNRTSVADWTLVARGANASVWENPRAQQRAFVPQQVLRIDPSVGLPIPRPDVEDFALTAAIEFDAWPDNGTDQDPERVGKERDLRDNPMAEVSTRADGPDLVITVDASAPTWVVVSETPWRGWRATLERRDGEEEDGEGHSLDLTFANLSMLAFQAPAGHSQVRLNFWPASFTVGLALASSAIAAISLMWLRGIWRRVPAG